MKDVLIEILTIIGYSDDKEAYADQFVELVHLKTMQNSLLTLPEDKQKEIERLLVNADSQEAVEKIINDNFHVDLYATMLKDMFSEMIKNYMETLYPTLSQTQVAELEKLLKFNFPQKKE